MRFDYNARAVRPASVKTIESIPLRIYRLLKCNFKFTRYIGRIARFPVNTHVAHSHGGHVFRRELLVRVRDEHARFSHHPVADRGDLQRPQLAEVFGRRLPDGILARFGLHGGGTGGGRRVHTYNKQRA